MRIHNEERVFESFLVMHSVLIWFGHNERLGEDQMVKRIMGSYVRGRKGIGWMV